MIWTDRRIKRGFLISAVAVFLLTGVVGTLAAWKHNSEFLSHASGAAEYFAIIVLILSCYLFPVFESYRSDGSNLRDLTPKGRLRILILVVWLPTLSILGYLAFSLVIDLANIVALGSSHFLHISKRDASFLIVAVILAGPSAFFASKVRRGVQVSTAMMRICFVCGYDLHGNPGATACPECGATLLQFKEKRHEATADPGQGPEGHDRA